MEVKLTPTAEEALSEVLASGRYENEADVVEQAILLIKLRDWEDELKASIQEGFAAIERGEGFELNDELWEELYREGDELDRIEEEKRLRRK